MIGLANLGNTCFLNTLLQCLFQTEKLNDYLIEGKHVRYIDAKRDTGKLPIEKYQLANEYAELHKLMRENPNATIRPSRFLAVFQLIAKKKGRQMFAGFMQNDVAEFLLLFLECLHEEIGREVNIAVHGEAKTLKDRLAKISYEAITREFKGNYSHIVETFYMMQISAIERVEDDSEAITMSYNAQPEPVLNLEIVGGTLGECLDTHTSKQEISDAKNLKSRQISYNSFGNVLIIALKRFNHMGRKVQQMVECPVTLDMSKYVCGYNPRQYKYELYGVCNHTGTLSGGHYYAYVKNNNAWFEANDTFIMPRDADKIITPNAYCMFYKKIAK